MGATDWLAATATVLLAVVLGALLVALASVVRTLRRLRVTVDALRADTLGLLERMEVTVREAEDEVDRVETLLHTAEVIGGRAEGASRLVSRTVGSPVVKAVALGAGTKRAVQRMRARADGRDRDGV